MAQTSIKPTETKAVEPEQVIEVDPKRITLQSAGFAWRELLVRLPEGATQDDLRSPWIWRKCQRVAVSALIKLDRLFILAFDESWYAEVIVSNASGTGATLVIQKVGAFREPEERLFSDGTHEVFWRGFGYGVRRCSDESPIGSKAYSTEGQARAAISTMTPSAVIQ